ncbi:hypothetical protein K2173_007656 [Erythroxylum novogranatense]|uniref:RRM domain-containing protein n=1 Tax=Erythroxylum novogranatense TaxID=1862640 RepID=A0AAV8TS50_9ROSI|nr:hypothetical protein K2173_007656 [Erythroxylum novogranatense]
MRAIFCGNFEYDARQSELERLFKRYGRVERVDMKSGFAFIYMEDDRDAEDAIRGLDRMEFGRKGRRLRVEWTKQERGIRRPAGGGSRRSANNMRPSKTLFVINFDPHDTRTRDLERRSYDKRRSPSPYRRERGSPDYGRGPSPYRRERASPDYGRHRRPNPNSYKRDRASPEYGWVSSRSPYRRERDESDFVRGPSRSPYRKERVSPDNGHGPSDSPYQRDRRSPENGRGRSLSPYGRERANPDNGRGSSRSPSPRNHRQAIESPMNDRYRSRSPAGDE